MSEWVSDIYTRTMNCTILNIFCTCFSPRQQQPCSLPNFAQKILNVISLWILCDILCSWIHLAHFQNCLHNFITSVFLWNTQWLFEKDRTNALTWAVTSSAVPSICLAPSTCIDTSTQFCQFVSRNVHAGIYVFFACCVAFKRFFFSSSSSNGQTEVIVSVRICLLIGRFAKKAVTWLKSRHWPVFYISW
jgi:hypothetical protein